MTTLPEWIVLSCAIIEPVGSRVVCDPPPTDTDINWLCLTNPNMILELFVSELSNDGWTREGSAVKWGYSLRKGEDNLCVTDNGKYFNAFMKVTEEAKKLNLLNKKARVDFYNKRLKELSPKTLRKAIDWNTLVADVYNNPPGQVLGANQAEIEF